MYAAICITSGTGFKTAPNITMLIEISWCILQPNDHVRPQSTADLKP